MHRVAQKWHTGVGQNIQNLYFPALNLLTPFYHTSFYPSWTGGEGLFGGAIRPVPVPSTCLLVLLDFVSLFLSFSTPTNCQCQTHKTPLGHCTLLAALAIVNICLQMFTYMVYLLVSITQQLYYVMCNVAIHEKYQPFCMLENWHSL